MFVTCPALSRSLKLTLCIILSTYAQNGPTSPLMSHRAREILHRACSAAICCVVCNADSAIQCFACSCICNCEAWIIACCVCASVCGGSLDGLLGDVSIALPPIDIRLLVLGLFPACVSMVLWLCVLVLPLLALVLIVVAVVVQIVEQKVQVL